MDTRGIQEGMTVRSRDGEKLGKVVQCADDFFLVEKGFFFPKDYVARYEQVDRVADDEVHLRETASSLQEAGTEAESRTTTESRGTTSVAREDVSVPLAEEELTAEKRVRDAGEVRVRKEVVTEQRQVTVPVTREEVHVERVPVSGAPAAGTEAFQEKTISVPITEEEVEIRKRPVVREEVRVSKTRHQEERRAEADVRHEEARIENTGDLKREGKGPLGEPEK